MDELFSQSQVKLLAANEQRVLDVAADHVPVKEAAENVLHVSRKPASHQSLGLRDDQRLAHFLI